MLDLPESAGPATGTGLLKSTFWSEFAILSHARLGILGRSVNMRQIWKPTLGFLLVTSAVGGCVDVTGQARTQTAVTQQAALQASPGDDPLATSQLVQMEVYLKQLGYPVGDVDGVVGPSTRAAIGAFQQSRGLAPNGYYTTSLLAALDNAVTDRLGTGRTTTRPATTTRRSRQWRNRPNL
jgi:peptidoglycan hydrolase-like protein with peptidoglycan-binding domain